MQVEVDVLHVFGGDLEPAIGQSHRTRLRNLRLPFRNFLGIAAVGHTHVAREAEFHGEVGVLRLVARKSELIFAALEDVVGATGDAVFGIVALARQVFDFFAVERHHLSHADVAQRNAHADVEIFRTYRFAVGTGFVPIGDGVGRGGELVGFAVGEGAFFVAPSYFDLAFGVDAVNALVVQHAAIVLEEGTVAARDVAQHGRETVVARTVSAVFAFGPHRRHGTAGIAVTTTASISRIDGTETVGRRTRVVIEAVALLEAACQLARHPRRTLVVSQ